MDVKLHPAQSVPIRDMFMNRTIRFGVIPAARGFGKSYEACAAALQAVSELCELPASVPNKNVDIIASTFQQVQEVYMPLLLDVFSIGNECVKYTLDGTFIFANGTKLKLRTYEAIDKMRGKGSYFVVCDEPASWTGGLGLKESWNTIIKPCIITRWSEASANSINKEHGFNISPGRAMFIGTPRGLNDFYDISTYEDNDSDWKTYHYTYLDSPYLDKDEVEKEKLNMTSTEFAQEYLASFEGSGNQVFTFKRDLHLDKNLPDFAPGETVVICPDFNVGIMATPIGAIRGNQIHFIGEMQGDPDTTELCKAVVAKYPNNPIVAYPDPTGKARKTSAVTGTTDFTIIESYGIEVRARNASPKLKDSVTAVNRQLINAEGQVNMFFCPNRCPNTIKSMERTVLKEGNPDSFQIDKSKGVEHWSDGVRYMAEYEFPIAPTVYNYIASSRPGLGIIK